MAGEQRVQWNSSSRALRTSLVDNKDSKQKNKTFHERPAYSSSWSPSTEFSEIVAESRSYQIRKQIDPRGHLLDVLDVQAPRDKTKRRASLVKAGTVNNLQAPPKVLESGSLLRTSGVSNVGAVEGKFLFSRASTVRYTKARLTPELSRLSPVKERGCATVEESPCSVSSTDHNSSPDNPSSTPPPWRRWSEPARSETLPEPGRNSHDSPSCATPSGRRLSAPERIPRRWSDAGRNPTANARPATPLSPIGTHPRLQIYWLGLDRSFDSEFFPERSHTPLVRAARGCIPLERTVSLT